jgi:hypothetical protein
LLGVRVVGIGAPALRFAALVPTLFDTRYWRR